LLPITLDCCRLLKSGTCEGLRLYSSAAGYCHFMPRVPGIFPGTRTGQSRTQVYRRAKQLPLRYIASALVVEELGVNCYKSEVRAHDGTTSRVGSMGREDSNLSTLLSSCFNLW
jgi:hypothetical protein